MREWSESIFIDGWVHGGAGTQEVLEVATGQALARAGLADAADVDPAVAATGAAARRWGALPPPERAAGLRRLRDVVAAEADTLTEWLVREAGATRMKAAREIRAAQAELDHAADLAVGEWGRDVVTDQRRQAVLREPVGVVGVITPFNAPLVLAFRAIAPALAFGNAVVLKPDPRTAVAGGLLYPELLARAGLPAGVLSVLPGGADVGAALTEHPGVGSVLFTGSTPAGRKVGEAAGRTLKRVGLELGGNNPVLVLPDADVEAAAARAVTSSFLHAGQICMAAGQYLVHERIYEEFVEAFTQRAALLRVGDPWREDVDMGPVIDDAAVQRLAGMVESSLAAGAVLLCGGTPAARFFPATVLSDVPLNAAAWREEAFGPVAPLRPVSSVEEALALLADSPYGLVAAVHTGDAERGRALAAQLPAGTVRINDVTNHDDPRTPMAGRRASGNGSAFGGDEMLELITAIRLVSHTTST